LQQSNANLSNGFLAQATGFTEDEVKALFDSQGLPSFDVGTNRIPRDMIAQLHKDEAVVPAAYNPAVGGGGQNNDALIAELRAVREELAAIKRSNSDIATSNLVTQKAIVNVTRGGDSMVTDISSAVLTL